MKHIKILFLITFLCAVNPFWAQYEKKEIEDAQEEVDSVLGEGRAKAIIQRLLDKELRRTNKAYSTGDTYYVDIDFGYGKIEKKDFISLPQKIKKGDFYMVRINNINPNWYKVVINSKDTIVAQKLEMPTFGDISLESIKSITEGFSTSIFAEFKEIESELVAKNEYSYQTPFSDSIVKSFVEKMDYFESILKETQSEEQLIIELVEEHRQLIRGMVFLLESSKREVSKIKNDILQFRQERLQREPSENEKLFDYKTTIETFYGVKQEIEKHKTNAEKSLAELQKKIKEKNLFEFLEKNKFYTSQVDELQSGYKESISKFDEIKAQVSPLNMEKLLASIRYLRTDGNTFVSLPIQFKGDREELSISFEPKDSTASLQREVLPKLVFPVEKRSYFSVGTGFYYSNLRDERFSTVSEVIESDTIYSIVKEEDITEELGVNAMMRFGTKIKGVELLGVHGTFGPGLSIQKKVRPRLMFGVGWKRRT